MISPTAKLDAAAKNFADSLRELERSPEGRSRSDAAFRAIEEYERLASEVYKLRRTSSVDDDALDEAESLLATMTQDLLTIAASEKQQESAYTTFIRQYRTAFRDHFGLFIFTVTIFIASCFLGWNLGLHQPDFLTLLADQRLLEMIHDHEAWFERIQESPFLEGLNIAIHNMKVSFVGFVLGAAFGFGGLYILIFNGVFFGAIFGYCFRHGFSDALLNFVTSHGPLELSLIVASCFAGLVVGRVFYMRPVSMLRQRLGAAGKEAGVLALGIIPWLLLAGAFEGFVSPTAGIPYTIKIVLGLLAATIFWSWTFAPIPKESD